MDKVKSPRIKQSIPVNPKEFKAFVKILPYPIRILVETYKFACGTYAKKSSKRLLKCTTAEKYKHALMHFQKDRLYRTGVA